MDEQPWIAKGNFVYQLQSTGRYRKGVEQMENRFYFMIEGAASQKECEDLAAAIAHMLTTRVGIMDVDYGVPPQPPSAFPANREIREGDTPTRTTD